MSSTGAEEEFLGSVQCGVDGLVGGDFDKVSTA